MHLVDAFREQNGDERTFSLKTDIAALEKMIDGIGDVVLVVIDTVNSYLGKTDSHKNAEVRQVLDPLSKMAERKGVAVVSITHFSKGGSNSTNKAFTGFSARLASSDRREQPLPLSKTRMNPSAVSSCTPRTISRPRPQVWPTA